MIVIEIIKHLVLFCFYDTMVELIVEEPRAHLLLHAVVAQAANDFCGQVHMSYAPMLYEIGLAIEVGATEVAAYSLADVGHAGPLVTRAQQRSTWDVALFEAAGQPGPSRAESAFPLDDGFGGEFAPQQRGPGVGRFSNLADVVAHILRFRSTHDVQLAR